MNAPDIVLCTACNEAYALGGAIALASALRRLPIELGETRVYVLDGGICDDSWSRFKATIEKTRPGTRLIRLQPNMTQFAGLPKDWGSSVMTYARLALPEMVQESRIIYVDADMVVQRDLSHFMSIALEGAIVAAAPDIITPHLGDEHLPLAQLGLPADAPYLQAGFLVIDLAAWRDARVSEAVLHYLRDWPGHARHWDQSALNVVLHQRWLPLSNGWNSPAWWAEQGRGGCSLDDEILHFVGPHKPWLLGHDGTQAAERFYGEVRQTAWANWRPNRLQFYLKMAKYRIGKLLGR